jgi:hypothetical protein
MSRVIRAVSALVLCACSLAASTALALAGDAPTTQTVISHDTEGPYFVDYPCLAPGGSLTVAQRVVEHITDFGNGVYSYDLSFQGTVTFVSAADGKLYEGRWTSHMSVQSTKAPGQYAVTIADRFTLTAADGDALSFTGTQHYVGTASGGEFSFEINHC